MSESQQGTSAPAPIFKMPVLVGKIGKLPRKAKTLEVKNDSEEPKPVKTQENVEKKANLPPAKLLTEMSIPIPYKEPKWSGVPEDSTYRLEVLKSGMIIDTLDITGKPFHVFGRLANCDVIMQHPTISRHHAVLQYKSAPTQNNPDVGYYVYDLGSTHGTFANKARIPANTYIRLRVGHMVKLGCSSRNYILMGPDEDSEQESDMSITETKEMHDKLKREREERIREAVRQKEMEMAEREKKREETGATWGMGEDADETSDLSENPFASTNNEELYLTDPKKTLRGYYEREGLELEYQCEERGVGQFVCRVELPLDDPLTAKPLRAEVIHKGKKKEAVVQCALEACRILDRHGLLRQSEHESRRRKERDWSAEDFYDSDDDNFLDRTGSVERKRRIRMQKYGSGDVAGDADGDGSKPLTYDELMKKCKELEKSISIEENRLDTLRKSNKHVGKQGDTQDEDPLDSFMSDLKKGCHSMSTKADISNAKMRIQKLRSDLQKTQRLAHVAKPAELPALVPQSNAKSKAPVKSKNSVLYGKRLNVRNERKQTTPKKIVKSDQYDERDEEVDSSDDESPVNSESRVNVTSKERLTSEMTMKFNPPSESSMKDRLKSVDSSKDTLMEEDESLMKERLNDETVKSDIEMSDSRKKRIFGPMRPPENYVIPENYFDQESDRDLPEITEK